MMNKRFLRGLFPLLLSSLACQPVIAIGRNEFLIVLLIIVVLLGPPLYRLARRVEEFLKHRKKDG
jgi:hypothetical protein